MIFTEKSSQIFDITLLLKYQSSRNNETTRCISPAINSRRRALVQQEALSCGTPLIVTPNAGAEDLIDEGLTGFIIPFRNPEKIAEKILNLMESTTPKKLLQYIAKKKQKLIHGIPTHEK